MTIFKDDFKCRQIVFSLYNSFELQVFQIMSINPITIALVYRPPPPPKANKDIISEFSDLLGRLTTQFDCFFNPWGLECTSLLC